MNSCGYILGSQSLNVKTFNWTYLLIPLGNLYGTSHMAIRKVQQEGRICILDIEIQGVMQV